MNGSHSVQERREQANAPHKRRRQRRKRLFPELPAGTPLSRGAQYLLPAGNLTRDRTLALALRKVESQGIRPWASPLFARTSVWPPEPGLILMGVIEANGHKVPLYMNPDL
jgi:hypothetical protein